MIIGQLSAMSMGLVDAAMVGRGMGTQHLASLTFSLTYLHIPMVALFGLITATSVLVAQAFGAGRKDELADVLRHGLVICAVLGGGVILLMNIGVRQLHHVNYLGQPPELVPLAQPYILFYSMSFVLHLLFACFRTFCEAQNRPWLPLFVMIAGIGLNVLLNWLFIFGNLGFPKWGLMGAGFASMVASFFLLVALASTMLRISAYNLSAQRLFQITFQKENFRKLLSLGLPSSAQIALEVGAFTMAAFMMGWIGAAHLAAHHVTIQIAAFSFMAPLGMSFAVGIRVGQAAGASDPAAVRRIGISAVIFIICWMTAAGVIIISFREALPLIFSKDPQVLELAASFLFIAALFQIFDGVQVIALGALRGVSDVKAPVIIVLVSYWMFALPVAFFLAFILELGGQGVWWGLLLGLALVAPVLLIRFLKVSRLKSLA